MLSNWFGILRGHHQELGVVEPFWEAQLAVLVSIVLYVVLPARLTVGPRWLVPSLEGVLLFGLRSRRRSCITPSRRFVDECRSL